MGIAPKLGPAGLSLPRKAKKNAVLAAALASPLEAHEQRMLFAWADLHKDRRVRLLYAIPNAGGYSGGFGSNARRVAGALKEGVRKGFPDIGLPVARWNQGGFELQYHGLFIELKRENARPSDTTKAQLAWHEALREQGYKVVVCPGWKIAAEVIEIYLVDP